MTDLKKQFSNTKIFPGYLEWFEDLELPVLRKKTKIGNTPNIEVGADSMRVGKTTAVKVISKGLKKNGNGVVESFEDFSNNPYLKESYSDPRNAILHSQQWFATRKNEQIRNAPKDKTFIQDVHPEMDFCYAVTNVLVGRMSLSQFEKYKKHYYSLDWESVSQPDILVYLKASDDVLLKRAKKSLRDFEEIDENYFLVMKMVNRTWLKRAKTQMTIIEVDTDDLDFSIQADAKNNLVEKVKKQLAQNGKTAKRKSKPVYKSMDEVLPELIKYKAVFLSGLPGSGKSYLARKLSKDHRYSKLTSDKYRKKISGEERFGIQGHKENTQYSVLAYEQMYQDVAKQIRGNNCVVVDATNLKREFNDHIQTLKQKVDVDNMIVCLVRADKDIISHRMKSKKGMANKKETYYFGWKRVYDYFIKDLDEKNTEFPDQKKLGIRVIEVWNQ